MIVPFIVCWFLLLSSWSLWEIQFDVWKISGLFSLIITPTDYDMRLDIPNTSLWSRRECTVRWKWAQTIQWTHVPLVPRGTLQIRIWFMRQWSGPTLEQTNKPRLGGLYKSWKKSDSFSMLVSWSWLDQVSRLSLSIAIFLPTIFKWNYQFWITVHSVH